LDHVDLSKADGADTLPKHDEGNVDTCDPQALGHRLLGAENAGVDELDRNGRSLNRPVPERVFQIRVCDGTLDADELSTALRPDSRSVFKNETADDRLDRILDLD